ncbi:MAG: DUF4160 domain-containing protein [Prevotellaceae bacterium]|nr:DUF4160 domain-containing protein [Prevotellaceae bacterium]
MPTIFIFFGFRFLFYSNDHEPIHVHIIKGRCEAKYNIEPTNQVYNHGFKPQEISMIESIITENHNVIKERWTQYFGKDNGRTEDN